MYVQRCPCGARGAAAYGQLGAAGRWHHHACMGSYSHYAAYWALNALPTLSAHRVPALFMQPVHLKCLEAWQTVLRSQGLFRKARQCEVGRSQACWSLACSLTLVG